MHLWHSLPFFDMLMRSNLSAGSRKEGTQGTVAVVREKTNVKGCVSQDSDPLNSILRKDEELGLNASAGNTRNSQDASCTKLNLGKKRAIWRHYPKRWTSWGKSFAPGFEEWTLEETSWQAECDSKVAWNLFWKKHNAEQESFMLK